MGNLGFYLLMPYVYMIFGLGLFLVIFKFGLGFLKDKNTTQIRKIDKQFIIEIFLVLKI